ncbi:hypothetical protein AB0J21_24125 [Streptomyces sp. NPDC049954]
MALLRGAGAGGSAGFDAEFLRQRLEQEIKARAPERSLMGLVARTAYWVE